MVYFSKSVMKNGSSNSSKPIKREKKKEYRHFYLLIFKFGCRCYRERQFQLEKIDGFFNKNHKGNL